MVKNWLRKFKNIKIRIWQYIVDWWEPCWPRKFNFEEEKSKIRCLWTELNFIKDLIEFIEGLKFGSISLIDESHIDQEYSILRKKSPKSDVYRFN
jgi:hypothetical protein